MANDGKGARKRLTVLAVPPPCDGDWDTMKGSAKVRHCASCKTDIFNISNMEEAEAEALLASPEKHCIVYAYRSDGTVLRTARKGKLAAGIAAAALSYPLAFSGVKAAVEHEPGSQSNDSQVHIACGIVLKLRPPERTEDAPPPALETIEAADLEADRGDQPAPAEIVLADAMAVGEERQADRPRHDLLAYAGAGLLGFFSLLVFGLAAPATRWQRRLDERSIPQTTAVASALLAGSATGLPLTIAAGLLALASARLTWLLQKQR